VIRQSSKPDGWQPCQQGEIGRLVRRLKVARRRKRLLQVAGPAAAAVILVVAVVYLTSARPATAGPITCRQARAAMAERLEDRLTPEMTARVDQHLRDCPSCRRRYEALGGRVQVPRDAAGGGFPIASLDPVRNRIRRRALLARGGKGSSRP